MIPENQLVKLRNYLEAGRKQSRWKREGERGKDQAKENGKLVGDDKQVFVILFHAVFFPCIFF